MTEPPKISNKPAPKRIPYFGDFVLFDEIGRGGMGVVYNAQQTKLDRPVALKVLHANFAASGGGIQRLRIEAEAVARLDHPNIVPIYEFGEHEGHPYLAMQLIEGESLAERIARPAQRLDETEAATIMAKIARAVSHAHQRGVLHRDLKPGNILVDATDEPHLIDFGLAKSLEQDAGITQTGVFLGTPAYASPEQAAGQNRSISTASDIYSLGAIFYALLTGRPPFVTTSAAETIERVINTLPPRPRSLRPAISADLETICLKCMEKQPARRYASALDLAEDIQRFLDWRPITARTAGVVERLALWTKRHPIHMAFGITGGLLLAVLLGSAVYWRDSHARETEANHHIQRQQLLDEIQRIRLTERTPGWSERAWAKAVSAAQIPTAVQTGEVRNHAAALLAGLDAYRVSTFTNYGASSVAFDRDGRRLVMGGNRDGAKLWDGNSVAALSLTQSHWGPVFFSPDGTPTQLHYDSDRHVVVLSAVTNNKDIREWELPRQPGEVATNNSPSHGFEITPDGSACAVVMGAADGFAAVLVCDLNGVRELGRSAATITALAISPDASLVATADATGKVRVLSAANGGLLSEIRLPRNEIHSLALKRVERASDSDSVVMKAGWILAAGTAGGEVSIWDIHTQTPVAFCRGGHFQVRAIAFSPDGTMLASGGRGPVKLWDVGTGKLLMDLPVGGSGEFITGIDFAPDGMSLAISTVGGSVHPNHVSVWRLEHGRGIQTLRGLSGQISKICFSRDGSQIAALSHQWEIGLWDLKSGQLMRVHGAPPGEFGDNAAIAFGPDGGRLSFASGESARLWNTTNGCELGRWALPPGLVDTIGFPDENHLLLFRVETKEGTLSPTSAAERSTHPRVCRIRNLLAPTPTNSIAEIPDFNWHVFKACPLLRGNRFFIEGISGNSDQQTFSFMVVDALTGKTNWRTTSNRRRESANFATDPYGEMLAIQKDADTTTTLLRSETGATIQIQTIPPTAIHTKAGFYVTTDDLLSRGNGVCLVSAENNKPLVVLGMDSPNPQIVQFSEDGTLLAWGNTDGTVTVSDLKAIQTRLKQAALSW